MAYDVEQRGAVAGHEQAELLAERLVEQIANDVPGGSVSLPHHAIAYFALSVSLSIYPWCVLCVWHRKRAGAHL